MSFDVLSWALPSVLSLQPYQPGKPVSELQRELGLADIIKLASNENPLGCSPAVQPAVQAELAKLALYPDGAGFELRQALARHHGLDMAQVTLGNGSNDLLEIIAHSFLSCPHAAVVSEYAFAIYGLVVRAIGARLLSAAAHDYGHDLAAMRALIDAQTRIVFIANPNNPTGSILSQAALREFMQDLPEHVVVVLDEAYLEYAQEGGVDAASWLAQFPALIICRTFSKAYGLAGLRVGYALSSVAIADVLNRVRQPFNVSAVALVAAQAALADQDFVARSRQLNAQGMTQMLSGLHTLGVRALPSQGNFLCVDLDRPAQPVYAGLLRHGVIVRPLAGYGLPQHLRISIGLPHENERCLQALDEVLR